MTVPQATAMANGNLPEMSFVTVSLFTKSILAYGLIEKVIKQYIRY